MAPGRRAFAERRRLARAKFLLKTIFFALKTICYEHSEYSIAKLQPYDFIDASICDGHWHVNGHSHTLCVFDTMYRIVSTHLVKWIGWFSHRERRLEQLRPCSRSLGAVAAVAPVLGVRWVHQTGSMGTYRISSVNHPTKRYTFVTLSTSIGIMGTSNTNYVNTTARNPLSRFMKYTPVWVYCLDVWIM